MHFRSRAILHVALFVLCFAAPSLPRALAARADTPALEATTQSLHLVFAARGAMPVVWQITDPRYISATDQHSIDLIDGAFATSIASSSLAVSLAAPGVPADFFETALYQVERHEDQDGIHLVFTSPATSSGLSLVKTYTLPRTGFLVAFTLQWRQAKIPSISVDGPKRMEPSILLGPGLGFTPEHRGALSDGMYAYVSPVLFQGKSVQTLKLDDKTRRIVMDAPAADTIRWAGIHSRYFLLALIPAPKAAASAFCGGEASLPLANTGTVSSALKPLLRLDTPGFSLPPGREVTQQFAIYGGPKATRELQAADAGLDRILFSRVWNWLRWLCFGLLKILTWLHAIVPSWGLSLILLAAVVRLLTFPVAQFGLREQARFNAVHARLRPDLDRIKLECKGDPQRRHEETTALYRQHGVSPFAAFKGCGWVLLQVPIFIALFNLIGQEYALRGAQFLWIDDLSQPDRLFSWGIAIPLLGSHFNILPILMGATQVFVSNASPSAGDAHQMKQQRRNMLLMAVAFAVLFYTFPAGLIIYWTAANVGHLAQQRLATHA